jgi:ubiquinone/menaquinone biosynthesis C-methylase UbiE
MNYGYENLDGTKISLDADEASERYSLQLYHHVATGVSLEGKDILEVGCGRGGGASYITRHLHPRQIVGVDINATAIRFDQKHYAAHKNLQFSVADAHELPFKDNSFDAILNIESAHHYKDVRQFLSEVHRVLKPDGYFLIACFEDPEKRVFPRRALAQSKLRKVREEDITADVIRAMDLDNSRRQLLAQKLVPGILKDFAVEFAGVHGTELYDSFVSGKCSYVYLIYKK